MNIATLRRATLASLAVLTLTVTVTTPARAAAVPSADRLAAGVTTGALLDHLRALQSVADRSGGDRGYDGVGFTRSVDYVEGRLRAAGYRVTRQTVPYTDFAVSTETLTAGGAPVPVLMTRFTPSTPAQGLTAPVAALPAGSTGCAAGDYLGVTGRIVVLPRAACGYTAQQQAAAAAGAAAVLIYYPTPKPDNNYRFLAYTPDDFTIPMASVSQRDGENLIKRSTAGLRVHLTLRGAGTPRTTTNLFAETSGGDPDNVVMAGGHLDAVTEGPGINDNGSTSAATLQTALALAPYQAQVTNKVRFAWWGAEELVDVGSAYYVTHLSDAERARIALLLNGELLGSPNSGRFVWDQGSGGSHVIADLFAGYLDRQKLRYQRTSPDSVGSDHLEFLPVGIPVGGIDGGNLGLKTPEQQALFGGRAGQMFDPCYHQPCDRVENLDTSALTTNARAMAWVLARLATSADDVRAVRTAPAS
ncbi:M28 family peptidase [Cryptosporangium sp. NPDC051539]|uniref:M28 family peptidase n=1 Tax=Cryptosporangium sp. NPDC051539 TaxID=3363962 RepID=UPI0037ABCAD5